MLFLSPNNLFALEPKILWDKTLNYEITGMSYARKTGEIIISGKYARKIAIFDKQSNLRFLWGPRVDRLPLDVSIADDYSVFSFSSSWTEKYKEKKREKNWDTRIHFVNKKGKEIWNKLIENKSLHIAPNGSYLLLAGIPSESKNIDLLDSLGQSIWSMQIGGIHSIAFSPDSNYFVATDTSGKTLLLDQQKNLLLQNSYGSIFPTSVSENGNYFALTNYEIKEKNAKVINKLGKVLLEADYYALVSGNGSKCVLWDETGLKIYSLADLQIIKSFPIQPVNGDVRRVIDSSSDGNYYVLSGKKIGGSTESNLFVIDLNLNSIWETKIEGDFIEVFMSENGMYFVVKTGFPGPKSNGKLIYFQVY